MFWVYHLSRSSGLRGRKLRTHFNTGRYHDPVAWSNRGYLFCAKKGMSVKRSKYFLNELVGTAEDDESTSCAICLGDVQDTARIACMHQFCSSCIKQWAAVTNTCPLCKVKFNAIRTITNTRRKRKIRKIEVVTPVEDKVQAQNDVDEDREIAQEHQVLLSEEAIEGYVNDGFVVSDNVIEYFESDEDLLPDETESVEFGGRRSNPRRRRRRTASRTERCENTDSDSEDCDTGHFLDHF